MLPSEKELYDPEICDLDSTTLIVRVLNVHPFVRIICFRIFFTPCDSDLGTFTINTKRCSLRTNISNVKVKKICGASWRSKDREISIEISFFLFSSFRELGNENITLQKVEKKICRTTACLWGIYSSHFYLFLVNYSLLVSHSILHRLRSKFVIILPHI